MRFQTSGAGEAAVIVGKMETGRTVTIALYDLSDGLAIALDTNACTEIGTTGLYRFPLANITTTPTAFVQIVWQMVDGTSGALEQGVIAVGGFPDSVDADVSSRESETSAATRASTNQTEHDATQSAVTALNDLSQVDVQSALDAQGLTSVRAALLDNLDASISSVVTAIGNLNDPTASTIAAAVWDALRSSHSITGSMGRAITILLDAMVARGLIDTSTSPWQEVRYVYDEADVGADGDTVVAERYDLYDQAGVGITGTAASGNNPLADPTIVIAERRRVA